MELVARREVVNLVGSGDRVRLEVEDLEPLGAHQRGEVVHLVEREVELRERGEGAKALELAQAGARQPEHAEAAEPVPRSRSVATFEPSSRSCVSAGSRWPRSESEFSEVSTLNCSDETARNSSHLASSRSLSSGRKLVAVTYSILLRAVSDRQSAVCGAFEGCGGAGCCE